jgi:single-strand DNA-binding protein
MSNLQIGGKLFRVYPTETKSDKFQTRDFAIEYMIGNYPQLIKFQLNNDKCDLVDSYKIGDTIKVSFDLRGREWNEKILTNLNAWRIELVTSSNEQPQPFDEPVKFAPPKQKVEDAVIVETNDNLPF